MASWKQQKEKPLFPDLLWSRPENKRTAGKLLIIGGQSGQFKNTAEAYEASLKAGAGYIKVLLPDSLQKLTQHLPDIEYAPSNPSGSFAKQSLGIFNEMSEWADHVLLAGDFGTNNETVTILDGYLLRCPQAATINNEALSSITLPMGQLKKRPITLILDESHLPKLPLKFDIPKAITSSTNVMEFSDILAQISKDSKANYVVSRQNKVWVSTSGEVTSTDYKNSAGSKLSAYCATWLMQQPAKPLEALTTACYEAAKT
jgi:hypothetical protein